GQWPALRSALTPLTIIVDAANVVGSRPDGWWRDRAGAARRLIEEIGELAMSGVVSLPESVNVPELKQWFPRFIVVLEGAAAAAADLAPGSGDAAEQRLVRVVRAKGSGDDEIVRQAAETSGPCLVVTADRELRARCEAVGAAVTGPRWLLDLL
ncbi:MAG TPA: NUDIX hydrolase, partial [Streptosporangiaceae bacterium]|nr:NUDIX hydrolase [Streptosporangiaceae bacterium]